MTKIWMAAEDPVSAAQFAPGSSADYMNLFTDAGAWQAVSSRLSVFKIYAAFLADASDAQLKTVINWANANGVQLALETGVLPVTTPDQPGWGVEGYDGAVVSQVQRLKDLGGTLTYLAMDEPYYFGTQWSGPNAAHSSVATIASQVAGTIDQLKRIYPDLQVGDIEPVPYTQGLAQWFDAYAAATGGKLAFFDADVVWTDAWQASLAQVASTLRADGITYGVIYNGTGADASNLAWANDAIAHFVQVEGDPATKPDDAVFQTWNPYPTALLPSTVPGTFTNVMAQYLRFLDGTDSSAAASAPITGAALGSVGSYAVAPAAAGGSLVMRPSGGGAAVTLSGSVVSFADGTLVADPTGTAGDVARLYRAAFGRAPDLSGLQYWTAQIDGAALAPTDAAASFAASGEFAARSGAVSDSGFVAQIYANVLGRAPSGAEQGYWTGALGSGLSRGGMLYDVAESAENRANTLSMAGSRNDAEATRLYQAAFDRAPDAAGLQYWSAALADGASPAQLAAAFAGSAEFAADYAGIGSGGFVVQLYADVLGRTPDAAGLSYWMATLDGGTTRGNVLLGFADSGENRLNTAPATHDGYVFLKS